MLDADVRKEEKGKPRADKGNEKQVFCGRPLWTTPYWYNQ